MVKRDAKGHFIKADKVKKTRKEEPIWFNVPGPVVELRDKKVICDNCTNGLVAGVYVCPLCEGKGFIIKKGQ